MKLRRELLCVIALAAVSSASIPALIAQEQQQPKAHHPWMTRLCRRTSAPTW